LDKKNGKAGLKIKIVPKHLDKKSFLLIYQ
jgi:hypothetical protein